MKRLKFFSRELKRWNKIDSFECKYKELFLKKLTSDKSFNIFKDLYQFVQKINKSTDFSKFNLNKIRVLSRVHFMFNKTNL